MGHKIELCGTCKNPVTNHAPRCPDNEAECPECGEKGPCKERCPMRPYRYRGRAK